METKIVSIIFFRLIMVVFFQRLNWVIMIIYQKLILIQHILMQLENYTLYATQN